MERRITTENHRPTSRRKGRSLCRTIALVGATTFLVATQPLHYCHADTHRGRFPASDTVHARGLDRHESVKHGDSKKRKDDSSYDYDHHHYQQQLEHLSTGASSAQAKIAISFFLRGASIQVPRVEPKRRKLGQSTDVENEDEADDDYESQDTVSLGISSAGKSKGGKGSKSAKKGSSSTSQSSTKSSKSSKNSKSSGKGSRDYDDDYVYDDDEYGNGGDGGTDDNVGGGDDDDDDDDNNNGGGDNNNGGDDDDDDDNGGGGDNNNGGDDDDDDDDDDGNGDNNNGGDDDDDDDNGDGGDNNDGGDDDDDDDDNNNGDDDDDNNNGDDDDDNGNGGDGDDDDDDSAPVSSPTKSPDGGGNEPTIDGGNGDTPTDNSPSVPTAPASPSEPPENREPQTPTPDVPMPTPAPTQPRCPIGADGLFGSQIGLSEEFVFAYQLQVVPSVTVSEINLSVLENIEPAMGERIVARLFDQCAPTSSTSTESRSIPNDPNSFNHQRRWLIRMLQTSELKGFSIRPRDNVVEEGSSPVECVNVEQVYPCYVIRGRVTTYTEQPLTDETRQRVDAAIQASISAGGYQEADSRVIAATWRDETTDPLPDDGSNSGGGDSPTPTPGTDSTPTTVPIDREVSSNQELEPWQISLIAVGGVLVCCMAYLCLRRRSHAPIYDDDDKDDDEEGSRANGSNPSFQDEPGSKKEKVPLVTPEYQPPQPQQMQSQQPSNDPYRDPYSVPSTHPTPPEEPRDGRRSRASSEGTPIEEASESSEDEDDEDDDDYRDEDDFDDENDIDAPPSVGQSSQPSTGTRQTAQDNQMLNPYRNGQENQDNPQPQWDEALFVQSTMPPPESTSEEFSSEYSEEEVDEEYEIEYVEDEEGLEGVDEEYDDDDDDEDDNDDGEYDDEDGSYSDEYDDDDDDEEGGVEVVEDELGKTPILPWLAQEEQ